LLVSLEQPADIPSGYQPAESGASAEDEASAATGSTEPPSTRARIAPFARWVVFAVFAASGLIATFLRDAGRDEEGSIVDTGVVEATEARVGDCLSLSEEDLEADVVSEFVGIPCAEPHQMEVFAEANYDDLVGLFPGRATLEAFAGSECRMLFEGYVGAPYDTEPLLDINYFTPEEEGWRQGDREVTCAVISVDGSDLIGSMQGMGLVHFQALTEGCYDLPEDSAGGFYGMHPRDCDAAHEVEVFATAVETSGPDAVFDDAALVEFGDATCQAGFEELLGADPADPELTWSYFYPSQESWADGDRSFTCYLHRLDEQGLIGSYRVGEA
jgi:hypothetical protein